MNKACTDCKLNNNVLDKILRNEFPPKCSYCGKTPTTVLGGLQHFCNNMCYYKYRHMND